MRHRLHPRDLVDALLLVYILLVLVGDVFGERDTVATVIAVVMLVAIVGIRVQLWRQRDV